MEVLRGTTFIAQLPMHTNVRVIKARLGWRILHVGGVNGHLHLISLDSCGGHLVCGRSCETVVPGIYLYATTSITVSTKESKGRTLIRACCTRDIVYQGAIHARRRNSHDNQ